MNSKPKINRFLTGLLSVAFITVTLNAQDYLQGWDVSDNTTNPLVNNGNVFGVDVTDRRIKDRELVITIDDTFDGEPSNPLLAGYFQEFDSTDCAAVRDFSGKTLSLAVYQVPVVVNMSEVLNAAPINSHFAFEIAFDADDSGSFSAGDSRYRTHLEVNPFILPGTAGTTFIIDLNAANFQVNSAGPDFFDLTKVTRIGFLIFQDVPGEGLGGTNSATFPNTEPNGYAWKFDNLSVCNDSGVLFHDDFDDSSLDKCKWKVGTNTIGRTQFGQEPNLASSLATLQFDTYNAMDPGNTFFGTEIKTACKFNRGTGLEFEARIRVPQPIANGLIVALFSYCFDDNTKLTDEIDVEILSNWINSQSDSNRMLISSLNDFDENNPLSEQNFNTNLLVSNLNTAVFNTYKVRLFSDRTEWYVNDELVYTDSTVVPDAPMSIRLNFWSPIAAFAAAYDDNLQPIANPGDNVTYTYEVDYMTVTRITDTPTIPALTDWGIIALMLALVFVAYLQLRREGYAT